ncbi:DAZ-associated protein 2-like [Larimichthys crocea]|uniref:DAZ-associated protein 2-like n=1 Tax=Larimichthys crocea TaxID=215358 RepID=UPI000F5FBFF3|nr:DAZ-associated protein 2-like [Larimichthys crocea]
MNNKGICPEQVCPSAEPAPVYPLLRSPAPPYTDTPPVYEIFPSQIVLPLRCLVLHDVSPYPGAPGVLPMQPHMSVGPVGSLSHGFFPMGACTTLVQPVWWGGFDAGARFSSSVFPS